MSGVVTAAVLNVEATSEVHADASVFLNGGTVTVCKCKHDKTADSRINSHRILSLSATVEII